MADPLNDSTSYGNPSAGQYGGGAAPRRQMMKGRAPAAPTVGSDVATPYARVGFDNARRSLGNMGGGKSHRPAPPAPANPTNNPDLPGYRYVDPQSLMTPEQNGVEQYLQSRRPAAATPATAQNQAFAQGDVMPTNLNPNPSTNAVDTSAATNFTNTGGPGVVTPAPGTTSKPISTDDFTLPAGMDPDSQEASDYLAQKKTAARLAAAGGGTTASSPISTDDFTLPPGMDPDSFEAADYLAKKKTAARAAAAGNHPASGGVGSAPVLPSMPAADPFTGPNANASSMIINGKVVYNPHQGATWGKTWPGTGTVGASGVTIPPPSTTTTPTNGTVGAAVNNAVNTVVGPPAGATAPVQPQGVVNYGPGGPAQSPTVQPGKDQAYYTDTPPAFGSPEYSAGSAYQKQQWDAAGADQNPMNAGMARQLLDPNNAAAAKAIGDRRRNPLITADQNSWLGQQSFKNPTAAWQENFNALPPEARMAFMNSRYESNAANKRPGGTGGINRLVEALGAWGSPVGGNAGTALRDDVVRASNQGIAGGSGTIVGDTLQVPQADGSIKSYKMPKTLSGKW